MRSAAIATGALAFAALLLPLSASAATPTPGPPGAIQISAPATPPAPPGTVRIGSVNAQQAGHDQFCGSIGPIYCMNAYGGGPTVRTNPADALNNAFGLFRITSKCNNGYTSANCPMTGNPSGLQIVEFVDEDNGAYQGDCIGDYGNLANRADAAVNVPCGGNGGTFIDAGQQGCASGYVVFVNAKWSGYNWSTTRGIRWSPNVNSEQIYLNGTPFNCLLESGF